MDIVERLHSVSGCTQKTFMHRLDWDDGKKIITDAISDIERLREALQYIVDGYGPDHGSQYCRNMAHRALARCSSQVEQP